MSDEFDVRLWRLASHPRARIREIGEAHGCPNLGEYIWRWMGRKLLGDRWSKLGQAGRDPAERVRLSQVFVDAGADGGPGGGPTFVVKQLELGAYRVGNPLRAFRPLPISEPQITDENLDVDPGILPVAPRLTSQFSVLFSGAIQRAHTITHRNARTLLIGGPGQGKSTVTQFLCQVHRACWIAPRPGSAASEEQEREAADILRSLPSPGLVRLPTLMLPVRFDLVSLARRLRDRACSVIDVLQAELELPAGFGTSAMEAVLKAVPVLLVLDGLDEVPISGGRHELLEAIATFLDVIEGVRGRLIVTTRPQGYSGEFGDVATWRIAPWSPAIATEYAQRLLTQRFGDQPEERELITERIEEALRDENTARLMTSPLQVTMMTELVSRIGRAPRERWRLFREYYRAVVARETQKLTAASEILRKYDQHVEQIHQHVGLLLQAMGEQTSGTTLLDREQLQAVVVAQLERADFRGSRRDELVARFLEATTDRLVFLVQPEEGGFGFEVRSLQEFFAAGALAADDGEVLPRRLEQIARSAYWRNTLVFAVGRVLEDRSARMQETATVGLCQFVDTPGANPLDGIGAPGSALALDLLMDGAVLTLPRLARSLLAYALRALELPAHEGHDALASVCVDVGVDEATASSGWLTDACRSAIVEARNPNAAWRTLLHLAELSPSARPTVQELWPTASSEAIEVLKAVAYRVMPHPWLVGFLLERIDRFTPQEIRDERAITRVFGSASNGTATRVLEVCRLPRAAERDPDGESGSGGDEGAIAVTYSPLPEQEQAGLVVAVRARLSHLPAWRPVLAIDDFLAAPSHTTLAAVLEAEAEAWEAGSRMGPNWGPWPVHGCLRLAATPADLMECARRARDGELGRVDEWRAAEQRWNLQGITVTDIEAWVAAPPFDARVAKLGMPGVWDYDLRAGRTEATRATSAGVLRRLVDATLSLPTGRMRQEAARQARHMVLVLGVRAGDVALDLTPAQAAPLLQNEDGRFVPTLLDVIPGAREEDPAWGAWIDGIVAAEPDALSTGNTHWLHERFGRWFAEQWRDPARRATVEVPAVNAASEFAHSTDPRLNALAAEIRSIPPDAFASPIAARVALALRMRHETDPPSALAAWCRTLLERHALPLSPLMLSIRDGDTSRSLLAHLWAAFADLPPDDRSSLFALIRERRGARQSGLTYNGLWSRLQLPQPGPKAMTPRSAIANAEADADVAAPSRIEMTNLRGLRGVSIDVSVPQDGGATLVLLGENGIGKTTLLRGIAFALADPDVGRAFLGSSPSLYVRDGAEQADCKVTTARGVFHTEIRSGGDVEQLTEMSAPEGVRPFVAGYGCRRGSTLGSAARLAEPSPSDDLDNLFDRPTGLVAGEGWLAQLKAASNERGDPAWLRYDAVREALKKVLPGVTEIDIREDGRAWVSLQEPAPKSYRLTSLSDGYLTTMGWVIDLMARWVERQKRLGRALEADFCRSMTGYALVDEIDMHLHPAWQARVLQDMRRVFPKLHFVVTTHNPLTLVGAHPGEVRRLMRDATTGEVIVEAPPIDPRLRTGSELYEYFFGIHELYPTELARKLSRYHRLAVDPTRNDRQEADVRRLREELRAEGVEPGLEPEPRAART